MKSKQENMSNQEIDHNNPSGSAQTLEETPDWNPTPKQKKKMDELMIKIAKNTKRDPRVEEAVSESMKRHPELTREEALEMLDLMV
ncbi:MAG: hypothetical protein HOB68_06350 [Candidatus Marinimicrobia bacterium]|jgi:hypothetical protein|nr:hypothetical protein [Candidatus Neomarinimicrobiota bacterium]MBT4685468.1 hypothetical protein [Candidatus Neomarinimicrobiota bacterium]MBT6937209.1 hypothetical protein [Candidatus Neomarinimicrobiota bacterium]